MTSIESNVNVRYLFELKEPLLWEHESKLRQESEQIAFHDENDGNTMMLLSMETGRPIHASSRKVHEHIQFPSASFIISVIEVCVMVLMLIIDGFAPIYSNPLIGPSFQTINKFGAKNPQQILTGEYWRLVSSIFLNIGLIDLVFSLAMILLLGVHLERRWGRCKFLTIYLISGIGGNIYGLDPAIDSSSVGSGGCLVGLLGAVQVELVASLLNGSFSKRTTKGFKNNEHTQAMEDSEIKAKEEEDHAIRCSIVVAGMLLGIFTNVTLEATYTSLPFRKDWAVLFGGMVTGMVLNLLMRPFKSPYWSGFKLPAL